MVQFFLSLMTRSLTFLCSAHLDPRSSGLLTAIPIPVFSKKFVHPLAFIDTTGMPVVSMNAKGCTNFLENTGMGIAVSNPEDLGSRWAEHRKVRERVIKERKNWTMENHIHKLEDFYREVASAVG